MATTIARVGCAWDRRFDRRAGRPVSSLGAFRMAAFRYPHPTSADVSVRMRGNRKYDTNPEAAARSALHALGYRFRKHYALKLPERTVRPDIVFTRQKVAVFIDGCFWHVCPLHGNMPRANSAYWQPKLQRNVERDRMVDVALEGAGWHVVRAWEHESPMAVVERIARMLDDAAV